MAVKDWTGRSWSTAAGYMLLVMALMMGVFSWTSSPPASAQEALVTDPPIVEASAAGCEGPEATIIDWSYTVTDWNGWEGGDLTAIVVADGVDGVRYTTPIYTDTGTLNETFPFVTQSGPFQVRFELVYQFTIPEVLTTTVDVTCDGEPDPTDWITVITCDTITVNNLADVTADVHLGAPENDPVVTLAPGESAVIDPQWVQFWPPPAPMEQRVYFVDPTGDTYSWGDLLNGEADGGEEVPENPYRPEGCGEQPDPVISNVTCDTVDVTNIFDVSATVRIGVPVGVPDEAVLDPGETATIPITYPTGERDVFLLDTAGLADGYDFLEDLLSLEVVEEPAGCQEPTVDITVPDGEPQCGGFLFVSGQNLGQGTYTQTIRGVELNPVPFDVEFFLAFDTDGMYADWSLDVVSDNLTESYSGEIGLGCPDAPAPPMPKCNGVEATIVGTSGRDVIRGTNGRDVIVAYGGNDVIRGLRGNDLICAGAGNDKVFGQGGSDVMLGQGGDDLVLGAVGNDRHIGGRGRDTASFAGSKNRVVVDLAKGTASGWGRDVVKSVENAVGSAKNDVLRGTNGANRLVGGNGPDSLVGRGGNDVLLAGKGNDFLNGGPRRDVCNGQAGRDTARRCEVLRSIP